jgi:hypothetical protein
MDPCQATDSTAQIHGHQRSINWPPPRGFVTASVQNLMAADRRNALFIGHICPHGSTYVPGNELEGLVSARTCGFKSPLRHPPPTPPPTWILPRVARTRALTLSRSRRFLLDGHEAANDPRMAPRSGPLDEQF